MNRQEFMKQLEGLLKGISPEEREEALAFYTGYFEDAGEENEESIIQELESPEKLAASIKAGLHEDASSGVYTENGYRKAEETAKAAPEVRAKARRNSADAEKTKNTGLTVVLIAVVAVITSPIWIGVLGGAFGVIVAIIGVLIGLAAALFGITLGFMLGGAICVGVGIACLTTPDFAVGLVAIGIGLLLLAVSILALILLVYYCGKAIPWMIRGIVRICQMPFQGKRGGVSYE